MPKERTVNPATAHLKSEKARALKKSKLAVSAQRNERLASRNPSRLERQISELKEGGLNNARDKKQLEELEKQLAAVKKAREKVGDKAPKFDTGNGRRGDREGFRGRGGGVLGKRGRDGERRRRDESSSDSETDEGVRRIPMPRDTPPPIPSQHRHDRRREPGPGGENARGTGNANLEPLGEGRERTIHDFPKTPEPISVAKTTYEAKPAVRDLRKEAVKAFMPAVVARKVQAVKGGVTTGRLLEEEEMEALEREEHTGVGMGQGRKEGDGDGDGKGTSIAVDAAPEVREGNAGNEKARGVESRWLEEEEERFSREVKMEDIRDEDL
ncbi:MAG: hypothetical protein Q9208_003702 [Pyrenodesmia sp. 3 TL-2023]